MRDPYQVLGVQKNASAADIKSAFRKLAKKLHPDANTKDPKAAARFAELNSAYEIVGDEDKRKQFDRGEIDAEGKPRFQGFEGFRRGGGQHPFGQGGGFSRESGDGFESFTYRSGGGPQGGPSGGIDDILRGMFGGGAGARGRARSAEFEEASFPDGALDVSAAMTVTLEEAAKGASKRVQLPNGKELDVKIPAGIAAGQQIRLKGQGQEVPGHRAGDVLITVNLAPHPHFKVDGSDLRLDLPITLDEAVLGGKVRVPTLDGAVELSIPKNTSSGRTFRLKGKGVPQGRSKPAGDLLVTVKIALPDGADADLEALMQKWRDGKPYNPRSGLE
jgi:DnaJ-class molecular chaperone